jgi:hypothetical protein
MAKAVVTPDLQGASKVDSGLALVSSSTVDHVLAWVFVGYGVPFAGKGGGAQGKATVVEPVGVAQRRPLLSAIQETA